MEIPWVLKILYENSPLLLGFIFTAVVGAMVRGTNPPDPLRDLDEDERSRLIGDMNEARRLFDRLQPILDRLSDRFTDLGYDLDPHVVTPGGSLDTLNDLGAAIVGMSKLLRMIGERIKDYPDIGSDDE